MVDYPPPINGLLEEAYNQNDSRIEPTIEFVGFRGMTYTADVFAGMQTNRSTGVQRRMVRYVNGHPSSWVTRLDSNSGRCYYLDKSAPDQPSTWTGNSSCPSKPFSIDDAQHQVHRQANPLQGAQLVGATTTV